MGMTMQQLGQIMTAQEFGLHLALEQAEPLPAAQWSAVASMLAAHANGPLKPPEHGRLWQASDFMPAEMWPDPDAAEPVEKAGEMTIAQIMDSARKAGMVH